MEGWARVLSPQRSHCHRENGFFLSDLCDLCGKSRFCFSGIRRFADKKKAEIGFRQFPPCGVVPEPLASVYTTDIGTWSSMRSSMRSRRARQSRKVRLIMVVLATISTFGQVACSPLRM